MDGEQKIGDGPAGAERRPRPAPPQLPPDLPVRLGSQLTLVVSATPEGGKEAAVREQLQLANPVYLTHLTTDKPMYQPGEVVRFRSLTLDRSSLKPAEEDFHFTYIVTTPTGAASHLASGQWTGSIGRPRGRQQPGQRPPQEPAPSLVLGPDRKPVRGIGAGEYPLDPAAPAASTR